MSEDAEKKPRYVAETLMKEALHMAHLCLLRSGLSRFPRQLILRLAAAEQIEWAPPVEAIALWYQGHVDGRVAWWTCLAPEGMYWEATGASRIVIAHSTAGERVARIARLTLLYNE